ncbi:tRNA lysidine(34) synthetase TilS [Rhizorhabdus sp.]|uniref:tRNA lysidine(34) synthetase TilS n=1 Tax=Rhizorhabdus sp. TaxID=1968843 RepID=UPI0035B072CA
MSARRDLAERFRVDLDSLLPDPSARIGLAVSGGPDSMALLLLAAEAMPDRIECATVDHGLRAEAAGEAALVAAACAKLGVPHSILTVEVERVASIQAAARAARYAALEDWASGRGLAAVATAHHADDQAETLLMRLGRGAGLSGLAGIRARRPLGRIMVIRPLLDWRRGDLRGLVADIPTVDDPSNSDPRHDRSRVRTLLADLDGRVDIARMAASAAYLAEAEEALAWTVEQAMRSRVTTCPNGRILADVEGLPREITRRILQRLIGDADSQVDGPTLDSAFRRLEQGSTATVGRLKLSPGRRILIEEAPPRR